VEGNVKRRNEGKAVNMYAMKVYGVMAVQQHSFLTSSSRPGHFPAGQGAPGTHEITGWVDTRAGLDAWQKGTIYLPCRKSNHDSLVIQ
jgi:hypothetical protein